MRWANIDSKQTDAPGARYGHIAVVLDAREDWGTELVILHGGATKLPSDQEAFLEDVAVFQVEQEAWVRPQLASEVAPGPRAFHCAASMDKGFVFFGGQALIPNTTSRTTFNDVWSLSVDSWEWKKHTICSEFTPSPRSLSSMVDIGNEKVMMFGGRNEASKALNDLWVFDLTSDRWTDMTVIGESPLPRIKQAMAFVDGAVWMYGGETTTGSFFDDLWVLKKMEGTEEWQWSLVKSKPKPLGRSGHCLTPIYDNMLACFGGHTPAPVYMIFSQSHYYSKEFSVLDLQKSRWVKCETGDEKAGPVERVCPTMVAVSSGRLFLFGGRGRDKIFGDGWWGELESCEARSPSSHSLSSLASSAVQMHSLGPRSQSMVKSPDARSRVEASKSASSTALFGSVWNSIPSLPTRGLLSRISTRAASSERPAHHSDDLMSPQSAHGPTRDHEMTYLTNGSEASRGMEHMHEGLDALYSYFDIDRSGVESSMFCSQPDDHYIDVALISYAQSCSQSFLESVSPRSHEATVAAARRHLMNAEAKEFKLGNLWLILADYKRLVLKCNVSNALRHEQVSVQPQLKTRFLHFTMETLRLSDLPELLLDYRHLVESL